MKLIFHLLIFICFLPVINGQDVIPSQFSYKTITFKGNSSDWVSSEMIVKKGDYVVFEVLGKVKLGLGFWLYTNGEGLEKSSSYKIYNRYYDFCHGALICKNGDELIPAKSSARLRDCGNIFSWGIGFKDDIFIGYYFISKETQELKFIINDRDYQNNEGNFFIKITVIPLSVHISRNRLYNKCPRIQPTYCTDSIVLSKYSKDSDTLFIDSKNYMWYSLLKEKWYHGGGLLDLFSNVTYRGVSPEVAGCQCTYNSDGILVNDNIYAGTYDFAYGIKGLHSQLKYHTLWDVFPHDLYIDYFKTTKGIEFLYEPTKIIY